MDYVDVPAPTSAYVVLAALSGEFVDKVITAESSGNAQARPWDAKTGKLLSSAYGAGQFIEGTWLEMVKKHRPDLAVKNDEEILDLRSDFELSREMTAKFAEENRTYLINHGFNPTDAALYLAHFAGSTGAVKLLTAHRDTPVEEILSPEAIEANQFLKGQTAATLYAWAAKKMNVEVSSLVAGTALEQVETLCAELNRKLSVYTESHPDIKALRNQIAALEAIDEEASSTKQARVTSSPEAETLRAELARKRAVYTDNHPDIKALRHQIAALEALDKKAGSNKQARVSFSAKATPHAEIPGCGATPAKDDAKKAPERPEQEARHWSPGRSQSKGAFRMLGSSASRGCGATSVYVPPPRPEAEPLGSPLTGLILDKGITPPLGGVPAVLGAFLQTLGLRKSSRLCRGSAGGRACGRRIVAFPWL